MKTINIELTDAQYTSIADNANIKGRAVDEYIMDILGVSIDPYFDKLRKRVNELDTGTPFTVKAVMATDWVSIPKGIRLSLGRKFYRLVEEGTIQKVKDTGTDPAGTMNYVKL